MLSLSQSFSGNFILIFVKATFSNAISQFLYFNDLHKVETFFQLKQYQQELQHKKCKYDWDFYLLTYKPKHFCGALK